ncbi:BnaC06g02650D [Brassica napus]|uniref:BnaC06g02650D protein n=1 Tax=Brassica napus TaxID=3708 RepID=A0A078GSD9_BRANA|nr:BnaC06g02650D [Brassica napus]
MGTHINFNSLGVDSSGGSLRYIR